MKVKEISVSLSKKISKQINRGEWNTWEAGFGMTADLEDGEDRKVAINRLKTEIRTVIAETFPNTNKGGDSNQVSNHGKLFGVNATLADQYR